MPENNEIDDCRVCGANGEVFAAFMPAGDPQEWSANALGHFASDLLASKTLGRNPRQFEVFRNYTDDTRALLISARATFDPKDESGHPVSFDDDLRYLVSTAKRYGLVPVGRGQADQLSVYLGFEAQIRESEKL